MTIASSGPLNMATVGAEYGAASTNLYLGQLHRGHASKYVRINSGDNEAINGSAGVPATYTNLQIGHFYGQSKGWTYTNSTVRLNSGSNSYHLHGHFGSDWLGTNGTDWPCTYVNNNGLYSTSTAAYALVIYARQNNGPFAFINNSEIQGAGGAANSGAGQHAMYIYNSENAAYANRPIVYNYGGIRGGGGGGGRGGTGGTGGQGYYDTGYTAQDGPAYQRSPSPYYYWVVDTGPYANAVYFGTTGSLFTPSSAAGSYGSGGYTYYKHTHRETVSYQYSTGSAGPHEGPSYATGYKYYYEVFRQYPSSYRTVTNGGGGGAGGSGGQGIGYNDPNTAGAGGAPGAGGGVNAGSGGYGGTGGWGQTWGTVGNTGNTGATGNGGNYGGGYGGAAGAAGGAAGYSIYAATKWGYANNGQNNGPYGGGVANS